MGCKHRMEISEKRYEYFPKPEQLFILQQDYLAKYHDLIECRLFADRLPE